MFVRLLGPVGAGPDGGDVIVVSSRVAAAVLAHLALARGRAVSIDDLVGAVWDDPPRSARNAIQVAISRLRAVFGADLIISEGTSYRLTVASDRVDVLELERLVDDARRQLKAGHPDETLRSLDRVESLVVGEPLAGLTSTGSDEARRHVQDSRAQARLLAGRALLLLGRAEEAVPLLRDEVQRDAFAEPAHALLMEALASAGRPADALVAYDALRRQLADELGADPSPEVAAVFARLLQPSALPTPVEPVARVEPAPPVTQLPPEISPLLGRRAELARVLGSFADGYRLLSLLGPGGVGKTRLAVAAAWQYANQARAAAHFVDLSSAREAEVPEQIARVLGVPVDQWSEVLGVQDVLLVLDNAEHVLDALIALLPRLLAAPRVRLLVTSQRPLKLRDERQLWVGPLSSEPPDRPAVRLLADRAGIDLDQQPDQLADFLALAERADGVPLVLELLASSLRWQTAAQVRGRLDQVLLGLENEATDRSARHLTIQAALRWSLGRAGERARAALGALSLFRGSFGVDAVDAVLAAVLPPDATREVLSQLVELSLVQRIAAHDEVRFRLLEPIRLSALDSELVPVPSRAARRAHAEHYLRSLATAGTSSDGSKTQRSRARAREHEVNLRLALEWSWAEDPELALAAVQPLMGARTAIPADVPERPSASPQSPPHNG